MNNHRNRILLSFLLIEIVSCSKSSIKPEPAGGDSGSPVVWETVTLEFNKYENLLRQRVAVRDVDGDGKADIFAGSKFVGGEGATASVQMWRGAELSSSSVEVMKLPPSGNMVNEILVDDFDQDGKIDLVVYTNSTSKEIAFLKGDGTGKFANPVYSNTINPDAGLEYGATQGRMVSADFTGDGLLDLVVAGDWGVKRMALLQGDGKGSFSVTKTLLFEGTFRDFSLGKLPVSKNPVLAVGTDTKSIRFFGMDSDKFVELTPVDLGIPAGCPILGDFNGDGLNDLVFCSFSTFNFRNGQSNGTWGSILSTTTKMDFQGFVSGDFNKDGRLDVAAPTGSGAMWLILGSARDPHPEKVSFSFGGEGVVQGMATGDVDGNGLDDVVFMVANPFVFLAKTP